jgi:hypothetical protein
VGDITQFMGQRLLSMWHDVGPSTVIRFNTSTKYWSLASIVAEARKAGTHIWPSGLMGGLSRPALLPVSSELVSFSCGKYHFLW